MIHLKPIYFPNEEDLDKNLFYPVFNSATTCRCMASYFTSGALRELALSLSHFLSFKGNSIQFLVSPNLAESDVNALENSLGTDESLIPLLFPSFDLSETSLRTKSVEALSYLVATKKIEIRIAVQRKGLFHTKAWLFETSSGRVAIHGSSNATEPGLSFNFEQLTVSTDFSEITKNPHIIDALSARFESIWTNTYDGIRSHQLTRKTVSELRKIYEGLPQGHAREGELAADLDKELKRLDFVQQSPHRLNIPTWLNYTTGDFAHQGEAIKAWEDNGCRGILSIATGGGKTLTSLTAAALIQNIEKTLLVIVAVPTKLLVAQWANDIRAFGVEPIIGLGISQGSLAQKILGLTRNLRSGHSLCEVMVITQNALKSDRIINSLIKSAKKTALMLIGDEVHNLGSVGFQKIAPDVFRYRLGLSATVERQFDDEGTQFLFNYFGDKVFEFPVSEAIGKCLVPFQYYVHEVELVGSEVDDWIDLSMKISNLSYAINMPDGSSAKERWKILCLQRRRIVESAIGKISVLREVLPAHNDGIRRTIIFCTDKAPRQLEKLNSLLLCRGIIFHQVTKDETGDKKKLSRVIDAFSSDTIQVLTSKRVLDEGFNVPQTEVVYVLASNTVRRQWVQRLGRVLRKSETTGKKSAQIHDFIVMPTSVDGEIDEDLKSLVRGEASRIEFFNKLSSNGMEENGAMDVLLQLITFLEGS